MTAGEGEPPGKRTLEIQISGKTIWQVIGAILATLAILRITGRYGWRRGAAVGIVYLAGLLFVVFMILILLPAIADLATAIGDRGAEWIDNISEFTEDNLGFEFSLKSSWNYPEVLIPLETECRRCRSD